MALIKCTECKQEISTNAKKCPNCGNPLVKKTSLLSLILMVILGFFIVLIILAVSRDENGNIPSVKNTPKPPQKAQTQKPEPIQKVEKRKVATPEIQKKREELIQKFIDQGYVQKIAFPGTLPRVWITESFKLQTFDDKSILMNLIWAYYVEHENPHDLIVLYDSITGKQFGTYSEYGLKLE